MLRSERAEATIPRFLAVADLERLFSSVNRRTLQRDLRKLVEKGLLREIGSGPTDPSRHYLPGDL